jgi:hypothetical protein
MAFTTLNAPVRGLAERLGRTLSAIGDALEWFATIGPRAHAMAALGRTSDAELARRGTTRTAEFDRILGPHRLR